IRLSLRFASSAPLFHGVEPGRSSGPRDVTVKALCPSPPPGEACADAGGIPKSVKESINPGYTVRPLPSMTQASSGIVASFATALITPRTIITVPFSIRGPDAGTTVAPRIAKYCGSPPCAAARSAINAAESPTITPNTNHRREVKTHMHELLFDFKVRATTPANALVDARG